MSNIPTAREFLFENADRFQSTTPDEWLIQFAKLHVQAALKAAASDAETKDVPYTDDVEVDKDSILNSYPIENIK